MFITSHSYMGRGHGCGEKRGTIHEFLLILHYIGQRRILMVFFSIIWRKIFFDFFCIYFIAFLFGLRFFYLYKLAINSYISVVINNFINWFWIFKLDKSKTSTLFSFFIRDYHTILYISKFTEKILELPIKKLRR